MSEEYVPKVVALPGVKITPELVLNRTTAKLSRLKAVIIVMQWDDGSFATDWSSLKLSELCMAKDVLQMDVVDEIRSKSDADSE